MPDAASPMEGPAAVERSEHVPDFGALRVAVAGDLVVDHYLFTRPRRLSREAPVLVVTHEREAVSAGGAANVARNLRALGASVRVFGIVGEDESGRELERELEQDGIDVGGLLRVDGWITPTKTRILAAESRRSLQQILRIDREPAQLVHERVQAEVAARVGAIGEDVDAVIVSDYEYGIAGSALAGVARSLAERGTIVVLDPRREFESFTGVTAMTPNMEDLAGYARVTVDALDDIECLRDCARALLREVKTRWLLVTRGNGGMALFGEDLDPAGVAVPASGTGEITDVCGAGDTAAAVFGLALASGALPTDAMRYANAASGVVVMAHGAAVCTPSQLALALVDAPHVSRLGGERARGRR